MRSRRGGVVASAVWAVVMGLCAVQPAAAREKRLPAPDWALQAAQTPTPASAKNARAVVLSDEYLITVDDQNHAVERERWVVRILAPEGRGDAHCMVEYDTDQKLNYFYSWTIAPDGRQFQARDTDFTDVGDGGDVDMQFTDRFRIVNPPGADPGSVVACETEVQLRPYLSSEEWQIQLSIPVVYEALELALPPGGHYAVAWSRYAPVKPVETESGHLRWEIRNVSALDLENLYATPPWDALAARMSVKWGGSAVNGVANQWRQIGEWMSQLEAQRSDPTPGIAAKAQALIAGAPDFYTKLNRITSYIQNNIRYFIVIRGIGGLQAHYAADIFRNGYGDCKDKTTLLIAMLQAVGIHAYYLPVDSERGVIDPAEPSLVGNHMITAIELPPGENDPRLMARVKTAGGKNLLIFDPTDEETPVGLIRAQLQGAYGNLADGDASQVIQMPILPPASAGLSRKGSFVLGADGSLTGDLTYTFTGGDAASERADLKEHNSSDVRRSWEGRLDSALSGLTLNGFAFHQTAGLDEPLNLDLRLSDAGYTHSAGPLLLLRPRVLGSDLLNVPGVMDGKVRKYPIEMGHPGRWQDSFDITLPPGYVVDETPDPVNVDVGFASYRASVTAKNNVLHYEREYTLRQVEIPAEKAPDFRNLEDAILLDEKGMVILSKH
jgi:transglutaminase-like putative cysteine protease